MFDQIKSGSGRPGLVVALCLAMAGCMSGPAPRSAGAAGADDADGTSGGAANPAGAAVRLVAPDTDAVKREQIIAQCQMLEAPENAECEARAYDGFEHKTDIDAPLP